MTNQYASTEEAVTHLYRRVADNAPRNELLEIIFDQWGDRYHLRPPVLEARLAVACGTEHRVHD